MKQDIKQAAKKPKLSIPNTQISLEDSQGTTNYLVISGIIVGAILLVGGYFIWNLTNSFLESSNKLKALEKQKGLLETKKNNLETLKNGAYKEIQLKRGDAKLSDAELILRSLPYSQDQKNLYAMVEEMTKQANVSMEEIKQTEQTGSTSSANTESSGGGPGEPKSPKETAFTVTIVGSYPALLDFLANTEKSARVINFRKMKLEGSSASLKAEIDFVSYYQDKANIEDREEDLK